MRLYESVIIARQDISTAQVETLIGEFSAIIENGGGCCILVVCRCAWFN